MAELDLLSITPHQVSRDLRGYSVFFYGEPKSGKTTIATRFPNHLLLAFEKGYNAIAGAMAQPVNSWAEFRKVLRQLKDPAVQTRFETVIVDTVDIAYDLCEKYICANAKRPDGGIGVDTIGDIGYGKGYTLVAKEFDEALRSIVQLGYGLVLISHATDKTFKDERGMEYNQIVPTLGAKPRNIVTRLCDIIGYSRIVEMQDGDSTVAKPMLFMRGTPRYVAGSRFKYTPDYIEFNYQSLVNAIAEAIDKQAAEDGVEYFTNERNNLYAAEVVEYDYDELMTEFNNLVTNLISSFSEEEFAARIQPKIIQITEKYLGKGQKVSQISRDQTEALSLIVDEVKDIK